MESSNPTVIAKFRFPHEAHVVKSYLESQGVTCFLYHENTLVHTLALGEVRLACPEKQAARARELLADVERGRMDLVRPDTPAPSPSKSSRVSGFRLAALVILLLILFQIFYRVLSVQ